MNVHDWHVFTQDELRYLLPIAEARARGKAGYASADLMGSNGSKEERNLQGHTLGVFGEYRFATLHEAEFDVAARATGDGHEPDVYVEGKGYAVKTISWEGPGPEIKIKNLAQIAQCDFIALCVSDGKTKVRYIGSVTRETFENHHQIKDYKYGDTLYLRLTRPEDL